MFKKAQDMLVEMKEQMRGGKGTVEIRHIFNKDEIKGHARMIAKITINPGCSIGLHEHVNEEEMFYIIKGKALFNDNGVMKEAEEGDSLLTGGGAVHSVENIGDTPLEMMAVILLY